MLGRAAELARIAAVAAQDPPRPWALTLAGEAGIGKSVLWRAAVTAARNASRGFVLTGRAAEEESGLAYAALTDLMEPLAAGNLDHLPVPQARALALALLLVDNDGQGPADARTVGTAVLGVLRRAAADGPLLLAIDDVQWIDSASARVLAFALRRAVHDGLPVGLLMTQRTPGEHPLSAAVGEVHETLEVGAVTLAVLRELMRERLGLVLTRPQLVRLDEACRGNPLLALEMGRELARLDRWPLPGEPLPVPAEAGRLIAGRIARLGTLDRDVLFVAAAASDPATETIATVLERMPTEVAAAATRHAAAGLLDGWAFTHPLIAAAALAAPPSTVRRALHARLAELAASPEERGRHAALAAEGPNATTAACVDAAALAARRRGAPFNAAAWSEAAADLTPQHDRSSLGAARRVRAARWFGESGAIERARAVLDLALADLEPGDARAEALELAAQMAGWCDGPAAVVTQAERALGDAGDPIVRARVLLRLAAQADHVGAASALPWAVEAVELLEGAGAEERDPDLVACALLQRASLQFATGRGDDEAAVRRAAALLADEPRSTPDGEVRPEGYRAHQDRTVWAIVHDRFDAALGAYLTELDRAHARGHDRPIPIIEAEIAQLAAWSGDLGGAERHAQAALDAAAFSDHPQGRTAGLAAVAHVAMLRGDLESAERAATEALTAHPVDDWLTLRLRAILGSAALARGDAATAARRLGALLDVTAAQGGRESLDGRFAGDLVEAAVAAGDLARARSTVELLEGSVTLMPRPWVRAIAARSRALLEAAEGDLDGAMTTIERALANHDVLPMPLERARSELVAGRIARRRKERRRAGVHLDRAVEQLAAVGAKAWLAIAEAERARLGRRTATGAGLTQTEEHVARLAARGLTNREVGEAAFLTPKSVEGVLARVYVKLGIRSRAELGAWVAGLEPGHGTGKPPFREAAPSA